MYIQDFRPLSDPIKKVLAYILWYGKQSWVYKYRIGQPFEAAHAMGTTEFVVDTGGVNDEVRFEVMARANVLMFHQVQQEWIWKLAMSEDRPAIIFSTDDHIERIEPFNPAFCVSGTHNFHGKKLEPGEEVWFVNEEREHEPIWVDKRGYKSDGKEYIFDIARNHAQLDVLKATAREADGVVASTEALAEVYRGYGAKNVYVNPNSIDFSLYPKIDLASHPNEVRILWTGGASHYIDLYSIKDPLRKVLNKYPQARLQIFGQRFPIVNKWFPDVEYLDWIDPDAYTYRLSTIGHDINLCALRPTPFAECKSAIKFYENSAICNPAATIGADFGPYQEIIDGETGFRYTSPKEFEWKLSELIENETLRKQLAANAQEWVHNYRDLRQVTPPYIDWLRETSENVEKRNRAAMQPREPGVGEASPDKPSNEPVRKLIVAQR